MAHGLLPPVAQLPAEGGLRASEHGDEADADRRGLRQRRRDQGKRRGATEQRATADRGTTLERHHRSPTRWML